MKPFLLLATRAEDAAADNEYESFLGFRVWARVTCADTGWSGRLWAISICGTGRGSCWVAGRSTPATRRGRSRRCSGGSRQSCAGCSNG